MRAFIKIIVLMMVCFAVGCTPEEEPNGGGNNNNNEPQSFTVSLLASPANGGTVSGNFVFNTSVDMGLPSGTLWAACNLGANTPEEYGGYFAWGETETKNKYGCENYWHCHGCEYNGNAHLITLTKYCGDPDLGYNGFTDDLTVLLPDDDAATVQLGDNWRMPTQEEWEELLNNTTGSFYTTDNEICGVLLTATNGAKLFLPAAGFYSEGLWYAGSLGNYWSSCLDKLEPDGAWGFAFTSDGGHMSTSFRFCGRSVRAVM